jgi:hypothetical protein
MNPSKEADAQGNCPLFKLAIELRDEIYSLVFAVETNSDGDDSIELNESTAPPSKSLTTPCQAIRSESRAMYRAAYQNYPNNTFTLIVRNRLCPEATLVPALSNDLFARIYSIRPYWQAKDHHQDTPLRFTSHFDRVDHNHRWMAHIELQGEYWLGKEAAGRFISWYEFLSARAMDEFRAACSWQSGQRLSDALACAVAQSVCARAEQEYKMWED